MLRLSERGSHLLDLLLAGDSTHEPDASRLAGRLVAAGLLHPPPAAAASCSVSVVIPVKDPPERFPALVSWLCRSGLEVTVVEDGSADGGAATKKAASTAGARLVVRETTGGPAAARNEAVGTSDVVWFLDADVLPADEDAAGVARRLLAHFVDPHVALVAPRVVSARGEGGAVARFEEESSPLDCGGDRGLVGPRHRLSYVPAAAVLVRRAALEEVGGFDERLRHGEDVDLVARLVDAGFTARYEPAACLEHLPRESLRAVARQRFGYGTAAASLDARRPGSAAPFRARRRAAAGATAAVVLLLTGRPLLSLGALSTVVSGDAIGLRRRLGDAGFPRRSRLATSTATGAALSTVKDLLDAVRRAWWPVLAPLCWSRRGGMVVRLLLLSLVVGHGQAALRAATGRRIRVGVAWLPCHLLIGALADASYTAGALAGCARARSLRALAPRFTDEPTAPRGWRAPPGAACRLLYGGASRQR